MSTKTVELITEIDVQLRQIDGALTAARNVVKTLENNRDLLRYAKNVLLLKEEAKPRARAIDSI